MPRIQHGDDFHKGEVAFTRLPVGTGSDEVAAGDHTHGGGGATDLDDLTDVTITSPAVGDRLRFNGTAWVNSSYIWRPLMTEDPATGNYMVVTDVDGSAIMVEG